MGSVVARDRLLLCVPATADVLVRTDKVQAARSLGNLVKNALEASKPGQTVTVSVRNDGTPMLTVQNESVMPPDVQAQIFQRSFSTKGESGRGIGTYSVKLLTENYLRGAVEFRSTVEDGTTFTLRLPGASGPPTAT